jgi:hypothetical protein
MTKRTHQRLPHHLEAILRGDTMLTSRLTEVVCVSMYLSLVRVRGPAQQDGPIEATKAA